MSTIPKAVLDKIKAMVNATYIALPSDERVEELIVWGYQLATDGREELEKELTANLKLNRELNELNDKNIDLHEHNLGFIDQITALQSQCREKELLLIECWSMVTEKSKQIEELKAENERLKGLVSEVDLTLLEWECDLHDENGKRVTDLRKIIAVLTKTTWEDFKQLKNQ